MALAGTASRYGSFAIALHWLTAILVLAAYVISPGGREARVYAAAGDFTRTVHETLGLAVFVLTVVRLAWRAADRQPDPIPMPRWMHLSSKAAHALLYALLIAAPVVAILGAWLQGHPVTVFGIGDIAAPFAPGRDLGNQLAEIHGTLGNLILWVAGLHAAAGIFHHIVLRDRVLATMLPGRD
jgi:cytochrome b561